MGEPTGKPGLARHLTTEDYRAMPPAIRAEFDAWLQAEGLADLGVRWLELGEGEVTIEHLDLNEHGRARWDADHSGPVTITETVAVSALPPAWAMRAWACGDL